MYKLHFLYIIYINNGAYYKLQNSVNNNLSLATGYNLHLHQNMLELCL